MSDGLQYSLEARRLLRTLHVSLKLLILLIAWLHWGKGGDWNGCLCIQGSSNFMAGLTELSPIASKQGHFGGTSCWWIVYSPV